MLFSLWRNPGSSALAEELILAYYLCVIRVVDLNPCQPSVTLRSGCVELESLGILPEELSSASVKVARRPWLFAAVQPRDTPHIAGYHGVSTYSRRQVAFFHASAAIRAVA